MPIRLLLTLKLRLLTRSLTAGQRQGSILWTTVTGGVVFFLGLMFSPISYLAVTQFGGSGLLVAFGFIQIGWLATSLMFGTFGEAFPLYRMRRYPVSPLLLQTLNVVAFPFSAAAIFFAPSLGATVLGAGTHAGLWAACVTAAGVLLLVALTGALVQVVLASEARLLRSDWVRGVATVVFSVVALLPSLLGSRLDSDQGTGFVATLATAVRWLPTASLPASAGAGALVGDTGHMALALGASALLALALVWIGAAVASRASLESEVESRPRRAATLAGDPPRVSSGRFSSERLSPLLVREFTSMVRRPSLMLSMLSVPIPVAWLISMQRSHPERWVYMAAVLVAFGAVGHSTNQFSFDLGGVRLYFLLPVDPRRVVLTKNVLCMTIVVVEVLLIVATATVFRLPLPWLPAILAMVGLLTALPVQLVIGNRSSVINAVPATWRMGMRPPRMDTRAAVAPMLGLAGVAVAVIAPLVLVHWIAGERARGIQLGVVLFECAAAWALWYFSLDRAARRLVSRREQLIAALATNEASE